MISTTTAATPAGWNKLHGAWSVVQFPISHWSYVHGQHVRAAGTPIDRARARKWVLACNVLENSEWPPLTLDKHLVPRAVTHDCRVNDLGVIAVNHNISVAGVVDGDVAIVLQDQGDIGFVNSELSTRENPAMTVTNWVGFGKSDDAAKVLLRGFAELPFNGAEELSSGRIGIRCDWLAGR
jgi:hypothetical protein